MSDSSSNDKEQDLEQRVERALRRLPLRTAPATLEARVHRELERLAARPWWRRSFAHWPAVARLGFLAACLVLAGATPFVGTWVWDGARSLPEWLYACLALGGFLYVLLFGLGAAAYRALYLDSPLKVMT